MSTGQKDNCLCNAAPKLIFACSGAADVGAVSDQAARKLTQDGAGKMFCMAGIGGRIPGIMKNTEAASKLLAIDGCPLNCVKASLENAGFTLFAHLQLADLGMAKGSTAITEDNIRKAAAAGAALLAQ